MQAKTCLPACLPQAAVISACNTATAAAPTRQPLPLPPQPTTPCALVVCRLPRPAFPAVPNGRQLLAAAAGAAPNLRHATSTSLALSSLNTTTRRPSGPRSAAAAPCAGLCQPQCSTAGSSVGRLNSADSVAGYSSCWRPAVQHGVVAGRCGAVRGGAVHKAHIAATDHNDTNRQRSTAAWM